ncbi:MAG TPA: hypothetical protein V6D47_04655 [Oscillatoriaceae cyanobacterium]
MTRRFLSTLAVAALAVSPVACQTKTAYFPTFGLAPNSTAHATVGAAAAVPGNAAVPAPPGLTSNALNAQVVSTRAGELTVTLNGDFAALLHKAKYQVLATVADIANVTITVDPATGPAQQQTIPQSALIAGTTSATFTGLNPGSVTITIAAYDASGANIGSSTQTVNVTAGAPTPVSLSVQLDPTYTGVASGSLSTSVTFTNGPTINGTPTPNGTPAPTGTIIGRYGFNVGTSGPLRLVFDHTGNAWIAAYSSNQIVEMSDTGTVLRTISVNAPSDLAFDATGNLWVTSYGMSGTLTKITSAGTVAGTYTVGPYPSALAFDALGNIWVASYVTGSLLQFAPSLGIPVGTAMVGQFPLALSVDTLGRIWCTNFHSSNITRLGPTGTVIDTLSLVNASSTSDPENLVFDAGGNAWVTNNASDTVTEVNSLGSVVGNITLGHGPYGLAFDHNAHLWVANSDSDTVSELDMTGKVLGTYAVAHTPKGVAVDAKGNIWVTCYGQDVVNVLAP